MILHCLQIILKQLNKLVFPNYSYLFLQTNALQTMFRETSFYTYLKIQRHSWSRYQDYEFKVAGLVTNVTVNSQSQMVKGLMGSYHSLWQQQLLVDPGLDEYLLSVEFPIVISPISMHSPRNKLMQPIQLIFNGS